LKITFTAKSPVKYSFYIPPLKALKAVMCQ
jgi:hypothetical protein